jgi:hypothetical protein
VFKVDLLRLPTLSAVALLGLSSPSHGQAPDVGPWAPPAAGVIRDGRTAISIARLMWFSMHPTLALNDPLASEASWQARSEAILKDGVWYIRPKLPPRTVGGGLNMQLSQRDGRVLQMYMAQ